MRSHCHLNRTDWLRLFGGISQRGQAYLALRGPLLNRYDLPLFAEPVQATALALTIAEARALGVQVPGAVGAGFKPATIARRLPYGRSIPAHLIIEGPVGLRPLRRCWVGRCPACQSMGLS